MIRALRIEDISVCAEILCGVYNNEMWQCDWSIETATAYLKDYFEMKKFVGFVVEEDQEVVGALFGHEKIWWDNNEVYIDEMFIRPNLQRKGYGNQLLSRIEAYASEKNLAGITLLTNRFSFAPEFYKKNGYADGEHISFMYKSI